MTPLEATIVLVAEARAKFDEAALLRDAIVRFLKKDQRREAAAAWLLSECYRDEAMDATEAARSLIDSGSLTTGSSAS